MYQVNERDKQILFRVDPTDQISKLTMMKPETIAALEHAHVEIVEDPYRLAPIWLIDIKGVSEEEKDKLDAVYRYLFFDAFDNLHG